MGGEVGGVVGEAVGESASLTLQNIYIGKKSKKINDRSILVVKYVPTVVCEHGVIDCDVSAMVLLHRGHEHDIVVAEDC